ncbi:hypothetical protein [Amycolatopsis jiangsuensis]|uniref:Uncharacterized protein n=1 Tax=Amycolatopsis jiangsuensis TaxID=1181879 RepID=A0A840J4A8_9PSEU|nr:hypothetical protein [Amycolatopsis jiangsuensis]
MVETITATYEHDNDDWTITVSGQGKELTAKAPGIIAARDRADQLVEKMATSERTTVVHLLNGNALEFTSTYMAARLTLPEQAPLQVPPPGGKKDTSGAAPAGAAATAGTPATVGSGSDAAGTAAPVAGSTEATAPSSPGSGSPAAVQQSPDATPPADGTGPAPGTPGKAASAKPGLPSSKQLPKEVDDRPAEEANDPGVTAGAPATHPAGRA